MDILPVTSVLSRTSWRMEVAWTFSGADEEIHWSTTLFSLRPSLSLLSTFTEFLVDLESSCQSIIIFLCWNHCFNYNSIIFLNLKQSNGNLFTKQIGQQSKCTLFKLKENNERSEVGSPQSRIGQAYLVFYYRAEISDMFVLIEQQCQV